MLKFSSSAKWILTGEHSVLRNRRAIAFPLNKYLLSLTIQNSHKLQFIDSQKAALLDLFQMSCDFCKIDLSEIKCFASIDSNIPMKCGLGSSAALCVCVAKAFQHFGYCSDIFSLARYLEHKFHKASSGLDVATVLSSKGIIFENGSVQREVISNAWPYMMLTDSGGISSTSACVKSVNAIIASNPTYARQLDDMMHESSNLCESYLQGGNFVNLKNGISLANKVFELFGLYSDALTYHATALMKKGAIAVKPIGSGLGGYLLSLWHEKPQKYLDIGLTLEKP